MRSIFSTQNLQTFFLRKYCRLPRRGPPGPPPGPPGPASRRGPPCPPPPGPPSRRGPLCPPPPECPPPECPPVCGAALGAAACLISSAMHFHPFDFCGTANPCCALFCRALYSRQLRLNRSQSHVAVKMFACLAELHSEVQPTFSTCRSGARS